MITGITWWSLEKIHHCIFITAVVNSVVLWMIFLANLVTSHNIWEFLVFSLVDAVVTWLKIRFCETLGFMTPHRSDGFLLTLHTGVFSEISLIVVSLSVKNYRTDIISSNMPVDKNKILDKISKIAHLISYEISWDLLNDITISEILLMMPVNGITKPKSQVSIINEFLWDLIM